MASVLTVKQLNNYLKFLIEGDVRLQSLFLKGEISNLKDHYASGHIYFTLKDNDSAINCIMFRSFASLIKFRPENGMNVILRGKVSVYEKDGQNRFYAEEMTPDGVGDIALKFEQTKKKLESEGLFDPASKRPLPKFPKKIAVVTSDSGAAIKDILNILSRRWGLCEVLLCPVSVQGRQAVPDMLNVLDKIYTLGDIDLCIIGRGGGSAEDLWAFNDESLAYKIYEAPFPVISAVGHETDFTICDFVADMRAPTPSAAAELAVPDTGEVLTMLLKSEEALKNALKRKYEYSKLKLERCTRSAVFNNPVQNIVNTRSEYIDRLTDRLTASVLENFRGKSNRFSKLAAQLDALSPLKTLSRGYAAVKKEGKAVTSAKALKEKDVLQLTFSDGTADCEIKGVQYE